MSRASRLAGFSTSVVGTSPNNLVVGVVTASSFIGNLTGTAATFTGNVSIAGTLTYEDVTNVDSVGLVTARSGVVLTGGDVTLGTGVTISGETSDTFTISTNGSERVRVDSSGRLAIGTTSPAEALEVAGNAILDASDAKLNIKAGTTGNTGSLNFTFSTDDTVYGGLDLSYDNRNTDGLRLFSQSYPITIDFDAGDFFRVKDSNTEYLRVDSDGRLLVGTSNGVNSSTAVNSTFQVHSTSGPVMFGRFADDAIASALYLIKSRNTTVGSQTIVNDNDNIGRIAFEASDGSQLRRAAIIDAFVDGTPGSADMPGRLVFSTTADGASSPTERLRIDSNGRLTQATDTYNFTTVDAANMSISSTGNIRRSTSSLRYKTNVETMEDVYADNILNARPVWYRSACEDDNPSYGHWGFIAEEISQIDPRLCFYSQNENGDQQVDGVAYDRFVPHLLNLIKRQKEQIETQGTAIAALEARLSALEAS